MTDLDARIRKAIVHFWTSRQRQAKNQGRKDGKKDQGNRSAVTGGAQLDGFINLVHELLIESGLSRHQVFTAKKSTVLPGWFRPTKEWDIVAVADGNIIATLEFKSQIGSFGNNFNNRTEEALGNATDLLAAYREGAFKPSARPWLGYFMLLEDVPRATTPVGVIEPHYKVFPEFRNSSYADRYSILCRKFVRERLYDAACVMLSEQKGGLQGKYREPYPELVFKNFAVSLMGHASAYAKLHGS